jgi:Mg2+-importing ATPase
MRLGFNADETLFRSAWFVESIVTELAVLFVLRTRRPFFQSRPSTFLAASSGAVALLTLAFIYSPLAPPIGLMALPVSVLAALTAITAGYVVATEIAKRFFFGSGLSR